MASFLDIAKSMIVNPRYRYMYDAGLTYMIQDVSRDIESLRNGQEINYVPYTGSYLAFYLNLLYREGNYTQELRNFIEYVVGPSWVDTTSVDIIVWLEVWVITEMERIKLRILESQYENEIRAAML